MTRYDEPTNFAWIITKDHLHEEYNELISDEAGTTGPSEAPVDLTNALGDPMSDIYRTAYEFRMWDDDGELYYTGRLATLADEPDDEAQMAPLDDFGGPNAGAVVIKYTNHPAWTMEY